MIRAGSGPGRFGIESGRLMDVGFSHNLAHFNTQMARYVDELGMAAPVVVRQQAGLLARTLIQLTPPKSISVTRGKIQSRVEDTFDVLRESHWHSGEALLEGPKAGQGDVRWCAVTRKGIYGVAKDKDLTRASTNELYEAYFANRRLTKEGRVIAGRRGKQTVYIWQKIATTRSQVDRLASRLKNHVGRLKAGWLPSWKEAGAPGGSMGAVPEYVMKHAGGARGYFVNGLGVQGCPTFTMANYAMGARERTLGKIMRDAMRVRAKAMAADILLYVKGVKKVGRLGPLGERSLPGMELAA